jgi:hypothetical protein
MEINPKRNNNTFLKAETKYNVTERVINIAFRIVFHSNLIFLKEKISNRILFIYFLDYY